jgi:hypothetical protein
VSKRGVCIVLGLEDNMQLEIRPVGNPQFPRFVIANNQGEVFDGGGWNKDQDRAMLYSEGQDVALAFNALQKAMFRDCTLREFAVTLNVRVRSAQPFTQKELEGYLERAVAIMLDHDKGTGPTPNSMVQLDVTWAEMKERGVTEKRG